MKPSFGTEDIRNLHTDILFLYKDLLLPFAEIERDLPFAGKAKRPENDAEHTFLLSMVALSIEERLHLGLDRGKIAQYALVHDLVEAYAGDVSAKASEAEQALKEANESEALEKLERTYKSKFAWISTTIEAYESRKNPEAKFVYAVDKLMGAYTWLASDFSEWEDHYPISNPKLLTQTVERLRNKLISQYPDLTDIHDDLIELLKIRAAI